MSGGGRQMVMVQASGQQFELNPEGKEELMRFSLDL